MKTFIFFFKSALFNFARNKMRTLLTSLGILIGVLSVILLIALGLGFKKYINQQFESLALNLLRILPGKILAGGGFRGPPGLTTTRFEEKDLIDLKKVREAEYVVPAFTKTVVVTVGKESELTDVYSSSAEIFEALNLTATDGILFTKEDVDKRSKVVVIGPKIAEKLFKRKDLSLDRFVKIEKQRFKVIGVLKSFGGGFGGPDLDSYIYMPYKTGYVLNKDKKFIAFIVKVKDGVELSVAKEELNKAMLKNYEEDEFSIIEQAELVNAISSIFNVLNSVLVAIAGISLVVGGIGIMNIMYVTVTERIKEIGIRRAIGARRSDILNQFLVESVVLSLFGGILGLLLAWIIVFFVQRFFPAYINATTVVVALGVSTAIGVIFGVFPARKAAELSPIEAIRYE
ncbi:MAG: ABC transporter permease [Nanoarchaeota archaeon]